MAAGTQWPKRAIYWQEDGNLLVSIPFTWELPRVRDQIGLLAMTFKSVVVGGPAVRLMPDYFAGVPNVTASLADRPGVLQRVNPLATRTTIGCPRACGFCGVRTIEPTWRELDDWPDRPILADNNILAASWGHLELVCERLRVHGWADFTQGLDARLLTREHANILATIGRPMCRLALDSMTMADAWEEAFANLRAAGLPKSLIRSYAIVGFNDSPEDAWRRCEWVEGFGVKVLPMWFHPLNAMRKNVVTEHQKSLGWSDFERRRIMRWFYKHQKETAR